MLFTTMIQSAPNPCKTKPSNADAAARCCATDPKLPYCNVQNIMGGGPQAMAMSPNGGFFRPNRRRKLDCCCTYDEYYSLIYHSFNKYKHKFKFWYCIFRYWRKKCALRECLCQLWKHVYNPRRPKCCQSYLQPRGPGPLSFTNQVKLEEPEMRLEAKEAEGFP